MEAPQRRSGAIADARSAARCVDAPAGTRARPGDAGAIEREAMGRRTPSLPAARQTR